MEHDKIVILDFGGQYAHLIANRVRRLGVFSEIKLPDVPASELREYKGIILSGGPMSVYDTESPTVDKALFDLGVPVLGICYGHQLMQHALGGSVQTSETKEYGMADLTVLNKTGLFEGVSDTTRVWMSHGDNVQTLAEGFEEIGRSSDCPFSAVQNLEKYFFGVQFHLEVTHTPEGMTMLDNFLKLCKVSRDWSIEQFIASEVEAIQEKVGDKKVFLLCSGGVDSTVCFALLEKALGPDRVYGLLVDHGMMRYQEADRVKKALNAAGFTNLHVSNQSDLFLSKLAGVAEPEAKRKIIGDLFWQVKEQVAEELKLNPDEWIMGQGTIYPDTIETGGTKHADKIKTHHNRVDLVQQMIDAGKVIEPIAQLYKDEVRQLGESLGLPHALVWRQPFPGPGLGVRILCADEAMTSNVQDFSELNQKLETLARSIDGLSDAKLQVLPVQSVGVQGDGRTYRHPVAVWTTCRDWKVLEKLSTTITNRFDAVNRVMLAFGPAEPFALYAMDMNLDRVALLQQVDEHVNQTMEGKMDDFQIWQFPVVLLPTGTDDKQSIVLRPIASTEAMTAHFARIDWEILEPMVSDILSNNQLSHVFYDLTHKPPGTIEWE